ncbi:MULTISPECIES: hypothetical protein [Pectobacterium]|uniref:hypothetical protein n=1 Tax=Pectobacterium TaxID=122277 RepID=UPI000E224172|nr:MULTISPECIES: hypothetical protein [Pectobacterium]RRO02420.1 hypothetical protein DMB83_010475 [Pectobacterium aquaticum]
MSLINVLRLYLDDDCKDDVISQLKSHDIDVSYTVNYSASSAGSLIATFRTATEAAKKILAVLKNLSKKREIIFVVTLENNKSINLNLKDIPHNEVLEIIDKAEAIISQKKEER